MDEDQELKQQKPRFFTLALCLTKSNCNYFVKKSRTRSAQPATSDLIELRTS